MSVIIIIVTFLSLDSHDLLHTHTHGHTHTPMDTHTHTHTHTHARTHTHTHAQNSTKSTLNSLMNTAVGRNMV